MKCLPALCSVKIFFDCTSLYSWAITAQFNVTHKRTVLISGACYNVFNIASNDRLANPTFSHQLSSRSPQSSTFGEITSAASMKIPTRYLHFGILFLLLGLPQSRCQSVRPQLNVFSSEETHSTSETLSRITRARRLACYNPSFGQTFRSTRQDASEVCPVMI